jgi:Na+/H+ antiporter NhaD/arsenite permease-like protein
LRKIFWITGLISFLMSPIADNLTTALLMSTMVMAVGGSNHRLIAIACINIIVAANAGGAFSPFGDITTLMVWQKGQVEFTEFFALIIPSIVNWVVTASIISFAVPRTQPEPVTEKAELRYSAWVVVGLFLLTISMAVMGHNLLHLPPVIGMMTGLGFLKLYGYHLQERTRRFTNSLQGELDDTALSLDEGAVDVRKGTQGHYDIYRNLKRAEWDTLMFFYGIVLCVGGLGAFGYPVIGSDYLYGVLGTTTANIIVGVASAIIDNIPVMFAVLEMSPDMGLGQ